MKHLQKMALEDNKKTAIEECICRICPSFLDCRENIGYCVLAKSKCIKEKIGCICGGCQVYEKLNLKGYYFCIESNIGIAEKTKKLSFVKLFYMYS